MLLTALRESGLGLGVISNFDYRIYAILEALGLTRHFDSIIISSEAGYAKPAPEIFRIALQRHSLVASQALHVGDSEALDVLGRTRRALPPCWSILMRSLAKAVVEPENHQPSSQDGHCVRVRSLGEVAPGSVG